MLVFILIAFHSIFFFTKGTKKYYIVLICYMVQIHIHQDTVSLTHNTHVNLIAHELEVHLTTNVNIIVRFKSFL